MCDQVQEDFLQKIPRDLLSIILRTQGHSISFTGGKVLSDPNRLSEEDEHDKVLICASPILVLTN